jgi:hypothetical protein
MASFAVGQSRRDRIGSPHCAYHTPAYGSAVGVEHREPMHSDVTAVPQSRQRTRTNMQHALSLSAKKKRKKPLMNVLINGLHITGADGRNRTHGSLVHSRICRQMQVYKLIACNACQPSYQLYPVNKYGIRSMFVLRIQYLS